MIDSEKGRESGKKNTCAEVLFLIFIAECVLGGSGRWLEVGPFSIRMLLFSMCFIVSLPKVFQRLKELARNWQVICAVSLGVYLLFCFAVGWFTGNKRSFIVADLSSYLTLALVPGFVVTMGNQKAIHRSISVIFWSASALALVTVILHIVLAFSSTEVVNIINAWLNLYGMGGLALLETGLQRIFLKSGIFTQVAIVYGVWMIGNSVGKRRFVLYLCVGILLCSCILSYTRGFWMGLAVSALILLLTNWKDWKVYFKTAAAALAVFLVFSCVSSLCYGKPVVPLEFLNRFDVNLIANEGLGLDLQLNLNEDPTAMTWPKEMEDLSDVDKANLDAVTVRSLTLVQLKEKIRLRPLFGSGLGENLDEIRSDGKTEYMYLDILMKTGYIGMILFVATFFGFIFWQIKNSLEQWRENKKQYARDSREIRNRYLSAAYVGVAFTSWFNPFLLNPMGITLLMLTSTAVFCKIQNNN